MILTIDKVIKDKKDCTGCHACENTCPVSCISMVSDNEGFCYPKVNQNGCIKCQKCIGVCPIINKVEIQKKSIAYACMNKDESIRIKSSSGGMFTLLAEQIIAENGVVFGAGFNKNFDVEHSYVETIEELENFRGSKYVQSNIGYSYRQVMDLLDAGRIVLFTGTPCQIGGLNSFLGRPYENLYCVDIVCHGVPSPYVWKKYIAYQEDSVGFPIQKVSFRCKDEGWKRFSLSLIFKNNMERRLTLENDLFMKAFLKDVCIRPSCYACKYKSLHRESDITLADFWGIQNIVPEMDDDKGTSLIFINSVAGHDIFEKIKEKLSWQEVDINEAVKYNSAAIKSVQYNSKRKKFFIKLDRLPFDRLVKKYCKEK